MWMGMGISGLDDLMRKVESLGDETLIASVNRDVFAECEEITIPVLKRNTPKSKDVRKSGIKGNRPYSHLADNIPVMVRRKLSGYYYMMIGWGTVGRKTPFFYAKYLEWGTSKMLPAGMFGKTQSQLEWQYEAIGFKHYEKMLKELE